MKWAFWAKKSKLDPKKQNLNTFSTVKCKKILKEWDKGHKKIKKIICILEIKLIKTIIFIFKKLYIVRLLTNENVVNPKKLKFVLNLET